ncbi:MAG TPA: sterol desaturase family protein [Polyangiaceae bacterium]|nr:sterol desaturase family protein [Polyangiaceae bacterium]
MLASPQAEPEVGARSAVRPRAGKSRSDAPDATHAARVSPRMFDFWLFERFSRAHPATPAVVYGPVIAVAVGLAAWRGQSALSILTGVVLGYLGWTLVEYWLHRLLFHLPVIGPKTKRVHFLIHGVHHDYPWDETRLVMPLGVSISLCVLTYAGFRAWLGPNEMWAPFAGFVFGYVFYDTVHWYVHAHHPKTGLLGWLRREHFLHHFKQPRSRFGVSCPWLDYVFATRSAARSTQHGHAREPEPGSSVNLR